ncbi:hypothetical protein [Listeria grayi]|uniref:Uncharacterized protein n=1 Tax=Listeria grayi DSM 20601 TaxID=525367 RepID=D7UU83_LISGR|nr:hypothetical protein [Listeria grayi]EFI85331.1 hypothetical protein HMPREF0556_10058 [Listeria grayi DSM 20601]
MSKFIVDKLIGFQERKELVAIYANPDADFHYAGYIEAVTNLECLFRVISENGEANGYRAIPIESIYQLETNTLAMQDVLVLAKHRGTEHTAPFLEVQLKKKYSLMEYITDLSKIEQLVLGVELFDDSESFYGYVLENVEDAIEFQSFDVDGRADGVIIIRKEIISSYTFKGEIEVGIENKRKKTI